MGIYSLDSDYGSGSSLESSSSWGSFDQYRTTVTSSQRIERPTPLRPIQKADMNGSRGVSVTRNSLEDVMQDFRMNGLDSPYDPEEQKWGRQIDNLVGLGPSGVYLRQKSWPHPDSSPAPRLPRPADAWLAAATPVDEVLPEPKSTPLIDDTVTADQVRVLNSLPNNVLYSLLKDLEQDRSLETDRRRRNRRAPEECRFCKNNGEREAYYRAHVLKDGAGRVRCPVLRAFTCGRCGASGDHAHTAKYCPRASADERMKSAAMMRSVRLASSRRRAPACSEFVLFGDATPSVVQDGNALNLLAETTAPLDPLWAALERKLAL